MTPAQLQALSSIHNRINNPDKYGKDTPDNHTVNRVDPDDERTPAVLASLSAMRLPRKK